MTDIYDDKLQNVIKNAESFLRSTMTSPIRYPAQEALIYLISRGNSCDDAIQEVKELWKTDAKNCPFGNKYRFWADYDPHVIFYDSTMLRTAEWCNIGGYEEHWKHIYKTTEHYHSDYKELNYYPYFPYFRSRHFLENMKKQLELTLDGYEKYFIKRDWKNIYFEDVDQFVNGSQYFCNTLLAAAYIFGTYQIQSQIFDSDFRAEAIEYLFKSQLVNGSWWDNRSGERTAGVYQASIAIHALCVAKPNGYEQCVNMAKKWLISQQHTDGYWEDIIVPCKIFLTVLVLDALELADGKDIVTFIPNFKMDNSRKDQSDMVDKENVLSIDGKAQTIVYKGNKFHLGGAGPTWALFELLYNKQGQTATYKEITDATGYAQANKIKYDLVRALRKEGAEELADKIKVTHSVGLYLEV